MSSNKFSYKFLFGNQFTTDELVSVNKQDIPGYLESKIDGSSLVVDESNKASISEDYLLAIIQSVIDTPVGGGIKPYNPNTTYGIYEVVYVITGQTARTYYSKASNNRDKTPSISPSWWEEFSYSRNQHAQNSDYRIKTSSRILDNRDVISGDGALNLTSFPDINKVVINLVENEPNISNGIEKIDLHPNIRENQIGVLIEFVVSNGVSYLLYDRRLLDEDIGTGIDNNGVNYELTPGRHFIWVIPTGTTGVIVVSSSQQKTTNSTTNTDNILAPVIGIINPLPSTAAPGTRYIYLDEVYERSLTGWNKTVSTNDLFDGLLVVFTETDPNKLYGWNGLEWTYIQDYNPTLFDEIQQHIEFGLFDSKYRRFSTALNDSKQRVAINQLSLSDVRQIRESGIYLIRGGIYNMPQPYHQSAYSTWKFIASANAEDDNNIIITVELLNQGLSEQEFDNRIFKSTKSSGVWSDWVSISSGAPGTIDHNSLLNKGVYTHTEIDNFINSKGQNSGIAPLNTSGVIDSQYLPQIATSKVITTPASVTSLQDFADNYLDYEPINPGDIIQIIDIGSNLLYYIYVSGDKSLTASYSSFNALNLLWDNISGKPNRDIDDIEDAVDMRHEHSNKATIDEITELDDILYFKGLKVNPNETYTNLTPVPTTVGGIVSGSTFENKTLSDMFNALLYPYQIPQFTSFSISGQLQILEIGQFTLPVAPETSVTFIWSTNNQVNISPNTIGILDITGSLTLATNIANDGIESIPYTSITKNSATAHTFRATMRDTNNTLRTRDYVINWRHRIHWGTSNNPTLNASQILTLASSSLEASAMRTYSLGAGGYKYICIPQPMAQPTQFKDASTGFSVSMESPFQIVVTNAFGVQIPYSVYRTTNMLGSSINIIAS
jgi:hypothetical protein